MTQGKGDPHGGGNSAEVEKLLSQLLDHVGKKGDQIVDVLTQILAELKKQGLNDEAILRGLGLIQKGQDMEGKKLEEYAKEFQEEFDRQAEKMETQTTVIEGVSTMLDGFSSQVASLTQALEEATKGQTNVDTSVLEPVLARAKALEQTIQTNTDKLAQAAQKNTKADPANA